MASTYSALKFELITTGEQSGTWGDTTNTNIGTAIQEAITGSADVTFSSGTVTLTLSDTNAAQTARNLRLNLTGTSGGAQNLIVPAIEKQYIVYNGCADTITVKNSTGTGVAIPAGRTMIVFNNGTNVVDVTTHATSLTLGSALPVASGGTGVTTSTGSGSNVLNTSPTLVTPVLGTPTSGNLSNCTDLPISAGTTGTLPINRGGTGSTSVTYCSLTLNVTGTLPTANGGTGVTTSTGSGNNVLSNNPILVNPALGTPSSGTLTNCTGLPLTTGVTGTLPNGNTTATSTNTANAIVARDASGNFTAGTITANLTGTASNATLATSATSATSATNLAGGAANRVPFQLSTGLTAYQAGFEYNSSVQILSASTFSGSFSGNGQLITNLNASSIINGTLNNIPITNGTINSLTVTSLGTNAYGTRTVSTSAPTGGNNGDIWYQY